MSPVLENVLYIYDLIRPYLDFGVIAVLIYCLLYFLRGTRGASVLAGCVIALIFLTLLTNVLKFEVLNWLLENFWTIASVALVVIFQPELRRAFAQLGSKSFAHHANVQKRTIRETVSAVTQMSRSKTGALIVFERQIGMATFKIWRRRFLLCCCSRFFNRIPLFTTVRSSFAEIRLRLHMRSCR